MNAILTMVYCHAHGFQESRMVSKKSADGNFDAWRPI